MSVSCTCDQECPQDCPGDVCRCPWCRLGPAGKLLAEPSRFVQGYWARDKWGLDTSAVDPTAVSWCVFGAVGRCYTGPGQTEAEQSLRFAASVVGSGLGASVVNDVEGHDAVLAICRFARL